MLRIEPKMQKLIHYYSGHGISDFLQKSTGWMVAYFALLLIYFVYSIGYTILFGKSVITSYLVPLLLLVSIISCYARLIYLLEKSLGNLENISIKEKVIRCSGTILNARGMLRVTELPSVKEKQVRKLKEEFLDKEKIDSKEKVRTLIEELERKYEYESKHKFFIPLSFSWFLALFIPIWTFSIKILTEKFKLDFQNINFIDIASTTILLLFIFITFYIIASFLKTTFCNIIMFRFPSTRYRIELLIVLLQEIYLWYCFEEEKGKEKDK